MKQLKLITRKNDTPERSRRLGGFMHPLEVILLDREDNSGGPLTQEMVDRTNTALAEGWEVGSIDGGQILLERENTDEAVSADELRAQVETLTRERDEWRTATQCSDPETYTTEVKPALDKFREASETLRPDKPDEHGITTTESRSALKRAIEKKAETSAAI